MKKLISHIVPVAKFKTIKDVTDLTFIHLKSTTWKYRKSEVLWLRTKKYILILMSI